ncbi:MAG: acetyl-CoA carboxylase biotin carboxyl carrier protein [Calditrichales bacterium]|nr:MAG: acetyl-CoA carboxylase biotin carboxyl carrier protein [Calditrichales bacterium]
MDIKEIRQLIKLVENAAISELEIVDDGNKVRISKNHEHPAEYMVVNPGGMMQHQMPPVIPTPITSGLAAGTAADGASAATESTAEKYHEVRSPMVGTFYSAPAPDADAYVELGHNVEVGQTLCIIEAMKLMNEIESDYSGKIAKIMVENAQPVEYNQVMFLIEK